MKQIAFFITVLLLIAGCGTSARRHLSDGKPQQRTVVIEDREMTVYLDDHRRSRKNADRIFDDWSEKAHLKSNITGRRLMSIAPKSDGCHLTYDYRLTDGSQQRVTLLVKNYTQSYRKKHRSSANAIVNGREYMFLH